MKNCCYSFVKIHLNSCNDSICSDFCVMLNKTLINHIEISALGENCLSLSWQNEFLSSEVNKKRHHFFFVNQCVQFASSVEQIINACCYIRCISVDYSKLCIRDEIQFRRTIVSREFKHQTRELKHTQKVENWNESHTHHTHTLSIFISSCTFSSLYNMHTKLSGTQMQNGMN